MDVDLIDEEIKERLWQEGVPLVPMMLFLGKDDEDDPLLLVTIHKWPRKMSERAPQMALPWTSLALIDLGIIDTSVLVALSVAKPVSDMPEGPPEREHLKRMAKGETEPGEITAVIAIETRNDRGNDFTTLKMIPYIGGWDPESVVFPPSDMYEHLFHEPEVCDWINEAFASSYRGTQEDKELRDQAQRMAKRPSEAWTAIIDTFISLFKGEVWARHDLALQLLSGGDEFANGGIDDKGRIRLVWQDDYDPSADFAVDWGQRTSDE